MKKEELQRFDITKLLLILIVFFIPYTHFRIAGLKVSEILMIGLIPLKYIQKKTRIPLKGTSAGFVLAFSAVIMCSAVLSFVDPIHQYVYGAPGSIFYSFEWGWALKIVRLMIVYFFMLSVADFCKTEADMRSICSIYVWSNIVVDLIIIGKSVLQYDDWVIGVTRTAAMAVEPSEAGFINSMAIIYTVFLLINAKKHNDKAKAWLQICVLIIGQLVIGSTGSLMALGPALAVAGCVYLAKKKEEPITKLAQFGAIAIVGACAVVFLIEKTSALSKITNYKVYMEIPGSSIAERLGAITTCLEMFKQRPLLGVGFGNYGWYIDHFITTNLYNYVPGGAFQPNNQYFQLLAELGIVGFCVYAYFVLKQLKAIKRVLHKKTKDNLVKGVFFLCMWMYLMIHNMTLPTLFSFQFWMMCAFVGNNARMEKYDR